MGAVTTILDALKKVWPQLSVSNGSIESKIIDVVGTYADAEMLERENTLQVINDALVNQKITNENYYRRKAVGFQLGDTLLYDPINQGAYYAVIDETKRLVKQSYVVGSHPQFTLLVNAIGTDGHLRKLTDDELNAFKTYFLAFQPIGLLLNIASFDVAKITDPDMVVYVQAGVDAATAADAINANLTAYESVFRETNLVSLSEIEDVIRQFSGVKAVGFVRPIAYETQLNGSISQTPPVNGVFTLTNGAFTFGTTITTNHIKVLQ